MRERLVRTKAKFQTQKSQVVPWLFCKLLSSFRVLFNRRLIIGLFLTILAFFLLLLSDLLFVLVRSVIAP